MKDKTAHPKSGSPVQQKIYLTDIATPLGPMIAVASSRGLCLLEFTNRVKLEKELNELQALLNGTIVPGRNEYADQIEQELQQYFEGTRKTFTVPLDMPGNDFAQSVWNTLLEIPYGQTWSYKEQSERMKNPKAIRAIAAMNGRNRLAIVVPCHRVIGSNGSLTGYAAGLDKKKWLLNFEREHSAVPADCLF